MMKGCEALWASYRHRRLLVLITNNLIPNTTRPPRQTTALFFSCAPPTSYLLFYLLIPQSQTTALLLPPNLELDCCSSPSLHSCWPTTFLHPCALALFPCSSSSSTSVTVSPHG